MELSDKEVEILDGRFISGWRVLYDGTGVCTSYHI